MTGERLFDYYDKQNTEYASLVKLLPYATDSIEKTYDILERCLNEKKWLYACYPGIGGLTFEEMDKISSVEAIGQIIDGYLYLVPNDWYEKSNTDNIPIERKIGWGIGYGGFQLGYKHDVSGVIDKVRLIIEDPLFGCKSAKKLDECILFLDNVKVEVRQHNGSVNCNEVEKNESLELIEDYKKVIEALKATKKLLPDGRSVSLGNEKNKFTAPKIKNKFDSDKVFNEFKSLLKCDIETFNDWFVNGKESDSKMSWKYNNGNKTQLRSFLFELCGGWTPKDTNIAFKITVDSNNRIKINANLLKKIEKCKL